ncbi:MAG: GNAT family N-acetyltransferase [Synergistales bacterium]|nr:GNAT family N-acetyltransferase [Synergistales bacterium]
MEVQTKIEGFTIRDCTVEDIPMILTFIRELAEYEKIDDQLEATEDILAENLFGDKPCAEVVFGCWKGKPVGFALYFHNFSTLLGKTGLYLEDLYVRPEMRGKGMGKALLTYLARLALERKCGRFEWVVLTYNKPAIDFYRSIGAKGMDDLLINRVTGKNLEKLAGEFS